MVQTDAVHYLSLNLRLMTVVGMWPHGPSRIRPVLQCVTHVLVLCMLAFWLGLVSLAVSMRHDSEVLMGCIGLVCGYFVSTFKWITLVSNRRRLQRVVASLSECLALGAASDPSDGAEDFERVTRATNTRARITAVCWFLCISYVATYFSLIPLTMNGTRVEVPIPDEKTDCYRNETSCNSTRVAQYQELYFLPFGAWPFVDTSRSPQYGLLYTLQATGCISHGWTHSASDCFFLFFVMFVCGQFEFLNKTIRQAGYARSVERQTEDATGKTQGQYSDLANCIRHHQLLLSIVNDFNSIYSPLMLVQFVNTIFSLCTFAFEASNLKSDDSKLASMMGFLVATMLQLYLFCKVGSKLTVLSLLVADSCYESDWVDKPKYWKKSVEIVIMRAQKPLILTGGPFYVITYETFLAQMQMAFSYFTVLRNLHDVEE
ncbi:odorant receptor 10-like [Periplaneta americana]|uniref:odorant receptor 10-like n=1 Tax=Periplaneta americana TaxID=6978 RepID=UPI0037E7B5FC